MCVCVCVCVSVCVCLGTHLPCLKGGLTITCWLPIGHASISFGGFLGFGRGRTTNKPKTRPIQPCRVFPAAPFLAGYPDLGAFEGPLIFAFMASIGCLYFSIGNDLGHPKRISFIGGFMNQKQRLPWVCFLRRPKSLPRLSEELALQRGGGAGGGLGPHAGHRAAGRRGLSGAESCGDSKTSAFVGGGGKKVGRVFVFWGGGWVQD